METKDVTGAVIRQLRNAKGWSLRELSRQTGGVLSASRISNYEQGLRSCGLYEAKILAKALGSTVTNLLGIDPASELGHKEQVLLKYYEALPKAQRDKLVDFLELQMGETFVLQKSLPQKPEIVDLQRIERRRKPRNDKS